MFADNLRFSWAVLTSSPKEVFSANNLLIFNLYVSDYWLLESILVLISFNYFCNLACALALSLKFYWAVLTSSLREVFYPANLPILFFNCSFSWLFCYILWRYYWIYLAIFWFWFADNLRFYWADFSYSSIPVF